MRAQAVVWGSQAPVGARETAATERWRGRAAGTGRGRAEARS